MFLYKLFTHWQLIYLKILKYSPLTISLIYHLLSIYKHLQP